MAYPDELLVAGERVVLHTRPHWKMLIGPIVTFLLTVGAAAFLAALVSAQSWAWIVWIALTVVAVLVVGRFTVLPFVRWRTTHFVVTTRRVLVREGLVSRSGMDIPMTRINTVQFRHSVLERMLGCGTLVVESASDDPLEFADIPAVERVHSLLYQEVADDD